MQSDTPVPSASTQLNQYAYLVSDPLGRPYNVLRTYCAQSVYAALGTDGAKRAECQAQSTVEVWGTTYAHQWRIVVPPDWVNYGASSYAVIAQCHDVNVAAVGRRPTLACEIVNNVAHWNMSNTANPAGVNVYSKNIAAGQELEFTLIVRWADGTNDAAANGRFDLYDGDRLVYSLTGQKNTWDGNSTTEPNPPYIKAGIYQPNTGDSWWAGRQLTMFHVATVVGTADETPASLRAWVNARLAANSNAPGPPYVPAGM
jgi:hypothetical protein